MSTIVLPASIDNLIEIFTSCIKTTGGLDNAQSLLNLSMDKEALSVLEEDLRSLEGQSITKFRRSLQLLLAKDVKPNDFLSVTLKTLVDSNKTIKGKDFPIKFIELILTPMKNKIVVNTSLEEDRVAKNVVLFDQLIVAMATNVGGTMSLNKSGIERMVNYANEIIKARNDAIDVMLLGVIK